MKRYKYVTLFILLFSLVCFVGCNPNQGQKEPTNDIDIVQMSQELRTAFNLTDGVEQVDASMVATLYEMQPDDLLDSIVYMSTGAKSDEIAIFRCKNADVAGRLKTVLEQRKEDEINIFKDYAPEEVTKLKAAIIFSSGSYALYCVSSDSGLAQSIIDSYF